MANEYVWETNPFQDFLLASLLYGADITDKELEVDIFVGFTSILEYFTSYSDDELKLLDFNIIKNDISFKVIGNNFITSLWLSGIFPNNPNELIHSNEYIIENIKYEFNKKTNKLTYQQIIK